MSESTVIEPYGAIIVQLIPNFWISVWAFCLRTANPLASINSNEYTAFTIVNTCLVSQFYSIYKVRMYRCTKYRCFDCAMV